MRNAIQLFALFFFFFLPFLEKSKKIFFSPLFSVSLAQPKTSVLRVLSKASFSILPSLLYIPQIFCFFFVFCLFSNELFFERKVEKDEKLKSEKSRDTLSLNFPEVAIHTHEYSSTLLHKQQCLLLLNKSRPSPASRPPRFKYVSLSFVFLFRDPIRSDRARVFVFLELPFCVSNTLYDTGK